MTTREFLLEYGVPIKKLTKILDQLKRNCSSSYLNPGNVIRCIKCFEKMGFGKQEIIKLIVSTPSIIDMDDKLLAEKKESYKEYCPDWNTLRSLILKCPNLFSLSIDNVFSKEQRLWNLGFKDDEIKTIFKGFPEIFTLSRKNILEKAMWARKRGFIDDNDRRFFTRMPVIFGLSIPKMDEKLECFYEMGFTLDEVITIVRGNPGIMGYRVESLRDKLDFILNAEFRETLIKKPMILIQSISLSKARIAFLKSRSIEAREDLIFKGNHEFNKRFCITQEALLAYAAKEIV